MRRSADLIRQDRIDILVDLTMHMAHNRLLVFARKPAPVQVTYLAYSRTTGLDTIDYRLSDPYLDPPGMDESCLQRADDSPAGNLLVLSSRASAPPEVGPLPALEQGHITFGCLNNFCKVNEPVLAALGQTAAGRAQLAAAAACATKGSHRQRVQERAGAGGHRSRSGSSSSRVSAAPASICSCISRIDIALDTFPYNGGTTTCDALWMGVPVVSLVGPDGGGPGRLEPAVQCRLAGTGGPIGRGVRADRQRTGQRSSPPEPTCVRRLRQRMEQSPLMDAPRFARNIEAAYRQMWRQWCTRLADVP